MSCNCHKSHSSLDQTLDELDFERGIWFAAQYGDEERLKHLLNKGICVDSLDKSGYTALHYAARNGHIKVCKLLVEHRCNLDAVTKSGGATALHRACATGKSDVVKFLIDYKCNTALKDVDGKNCLHRAAENNHYDICKLLVSIAPNLKTEKDLKNNLPINYTLSKDILDLLS